MATKKKVEPKEKKKITVIMEPRTVNFFEDVIVEFEADTFTLINDDKNVPMWAIISEDPASNVFLKQYDVYAIGFTENLKPMIEVTKKLIEAIKKQNKAIKTK